MSVLADIAFTLMHLTMQRRDATVTVVHSRTPNAEEVCRAADIVVAACGRAEMVKGSWIKPGAAVVDVGINAVEVCDSSIQSRWLYRIRHQAEYITHSSMFSY